MKKDITNTKTSNVYNEIHFAKKMGDSYPDQFLKLYAYDFVENCQHVQKYDKDIKNFNPKIQKIITNLNKSKWCVRKIYSLVGTSLHHLLPKLNQSQIYSAIIQILYIIHLMYSNGYAHCDFHVGNVGVVKTTRKYITIFNHQIPTYGYIYKAIDYGSVIYKKNSKHKFETCVKYDNSIIGALVAEYPFWKNIDRKDVLPFNEAKEKFRGTDIDLLWKKVIPDINNRMDILQLFYPEQHQHIAMRKKPKKIYYPILRIPEKDILYFYINKTNPLILIDYFIQKIT